MNPTPCKPLVYIASPYTKGDPAINTSFQMEIFHQLFDEGLVYPVAPLMSHFLHLYRPRSYVDWIDYDLAILARCDALLRLNPNYPYLNYIVTESSGATLEIARAKGLGLPVFYARNTLNAWANERKAKP